eukprot:TRINITY_DN5712_c0_g1_i2.p1 TRINITY_DN5712_c0_g1~~TRINITY_DN5712_c0_g1_i2.p1  ORF type:complete len:150 (-),score=31.88 TRINITY_DN5712_c0_g1_i2:502-951(-)
MILCILITNRSGSVLFERFYGVPAEEKKPWTSFLKKLGAENLQYAREEEELVASHRSVFHIVYAGIGDLAVYTLGSDEYDELGLCEVLRSILSVLKDVCNQKVSEAAVVDKYGKICLSLEEVVFQGDLELTDKDRVKRAVKLKTSYIES